MVDTIKFSQMTNAGDINNNDIMPSLRSGENVILNNPWTFLPPGSTAQRPTPSAEVNYRLRFNTDDQLYEYYDAILAAWTQLQESLFTQGPFITYTADAALPDAQNLGALADGILKQTITLGVATLDIAVNGTDYWAPGDALTRTQAPVMGDDVINKTYLDTALGDYLPLAGGTMLGDIDMGGFRAINAADPLNPQDYATKFYVDQTALTGTSVYAATINTSMNATQSGAGVGATLTDASGTFAPLSLDGVAIPLNEDVLVKNTGTGVAAANEGIYRLTTNGDGISIPWQLTRSTEYDTPAQINDTGLIVVQNGSTLAGTVWYNAATIITVDTTAFDYVQFGSNFALKGANSDITSLTGITGVIQAPTFINDSAGLPILGFASNASAVNYWTLRNSATLNPILIDASGTDSVINMNIRTKNGDLWISDSTTTKAPILKLFNAAGSFAIGLRAGTSISANLDFVLPSTDVAGVMKSDGSGNLSLSTTLPSGLSATNLALTTPTLGTPNSGTLTNCTGYTIANLADVAWTDFSGSIGYTGFSGTPTTNLARAKQIGKTLFYEIDMSGTSNATGFTITGMPVAAARNCDGPVLQGINNGTSNYTVQARTTASSTTLTMKLSNNAAGWTNSGTKGVVFTGFYETT